MLTHTSSFNHSTQKNTHRQRTLNRLRYVLDLTIACTTLCGCVFRCRKIMNQGTPYNFWAYFPDGSITGQRGWSMSSHGYPPSTVEPFIIDEKRIDHTVVIFWVTKRLMAQKSNLAKSEV